FPGIAGDESDQLGIFGSMSEGRQDGGLGYVSEADHRVSNLFGASRFSSIPHNPSAGFGRRPW
ncbi:MAG: hypothetical protein WBE88_08520, partial [Candidatus Acidiferrales bacterium]